MGQTNQPIMHFILFSKLQQCQTCLRSQISTAKSPDYCLTKRQKRWAKQSRRANENMEAIKLFPRPLHSLNLLRSGQDDRSVKFLTWNGTPDDPLFETSRLWTNPLRDMSSLKLFHLNPLGNLHKKQPKKDSEFEFWIISLCMNKTKTLIIFQYNSILF